MEKLYSFLLLPDRSDLFLKAYQKLLRISHLFLFLQVYLLSALRLQQALKRAVIRQALIDKDAKQKVDRLAEKGTNGKSLVAFDRPLGKGQNDPVTAGRNIISPSIGEIDDKFSWGIQTFGSVGARPVTKQRVLNPRDVVGFYLRPKPPTLVPAGKP